MSYLSAEVLKKIEANKSAALLRKQSHNQTVNPPAGANNLKPIHVPTEINGSNEYKHNNAKKFTSNKERYKAPQNKIRVKCKIISEERFVAEAKYHEPTIEIFKTIVGKHYDADTKSWDFPLTSHKSLVSKLQQSGIDVDCIPNIVVQTFASTNISADSIDISKIDQVLLSKLMPFQAEGIKFGISRKGRCLLADDMGLGKTIQALGIAHYFHENWPLLIVCPSSMRFPWEEAIQIFLPSVNPFEINVVTSGKDGIDEAKIVICSYDLMKTFVDTFLRKKFGVAIFDESHFLKNRKTGRTTAALQLTQRCKNIILLSGTPALSRPQELYTQISAVDPTLFPSYHDFGLRYCDGRKDKYGWNFNGFSNLEELEFILKRRLMIRRLKSEVLKQLPSKLRKVVLLHPSMVTKVTKQMKAFESQLSVLKGSEKQSTLFSYYAATGEAKLKAVLEYLEDKIENINKFLVFAHHKIVLDGIAEMLLKKGVKYIRIDGSTHTEKRKDLCDQFQSEERCRVAVLSIKAANTGLTLTAAQLVIFAELSFNPGELTQAEDRAHRIGQHDSVVAEYLVAKGTADDYIWNLVQKKLDVLKQVGLSKDNFNDADTEHQTDKNQPSVPDAFVNLDEHKLPDLEEEKLKNSCVAGTEEKKQTEFDDSFFAGIEDDDDLFANFSLDKVEEEYQVEAKKRKL